MVIISVGWLTGCDVVDTNAGWTAVVGKQLKAGGKAEEIAAVTTSSSSAISSLHWWWLSCTWVRRILLNTESVLRGHTNEIGSARVKGSRFWQ